jgi:hypothetical protein
MTHDQVKILAKHYKGDNDYPFFCVGFDIGFYKALDWAGVKIEDVKIPVEMVEFFRRKEAATTNAAELEKK